MNEFNKQVIVYGAGYAGKILTNYLLQNNINVTHIMVSPGHKESDSYLVSDLHEEKILIPIVELGEDVGQKETILIYVTAVSGKNEIINDLKRNGYNNVCYLENLEQIEDVFFEEYLFKKDVDLEKEILNFGEVKLYNPIKYNKNLKRTFYETLGDELSPGIFEDFSLVVDGAYEYNQVYIQENDFIIDAGANIGSFSCYAAQKGCTVYACEPGSQSLDILEKQKEIYDAIKIVPLGLSDEEGEIEFYESEDCALDSIYIPRGNTKKRTINIDTIDNLVAKGTIEKVDYIKADIEGAERYMLMGAERTLREMAPKLSICTYHYKDDPIILEGIIKKANPNYVVEHKWRKLFAHVPKNLEI